MLTKLERYVDQLGELHTKLHRAGSGATWKRENEVAAGVGSQAGCSAAEHQSGVGGVACRHAARSPCGFSAGQLLREIADKQRKDEVLLLDNLELLFERGLEINPLDLIKRLAHAKRVVEWFGPANYAGIGCITPK